MIWFTCKCGKRMSRPDSQAGAMVFCDCGNGVRVPWSSTAAPEPEVLDAQPVPVPVPAAVPVPQSRPLPVPPREENAPRPRHPEPPRSPAPPPPVLDLPLPSRERRIPRRVRPNLCFNHDEDPSVEVCSVCRLPFCGNCLVSIQGEAYCGPCKNFKMAGMSRAERPLPLAVMALVVSLVSGPVMAVLSMLAIGLYLGEGLAAVAFVLCLLALALPLTGLILATTALRRLESQPQYSGRGMAAGGACTALVGILWPCAVAAVVIARFTWG